ncbi:Aerobic respiration control sensor protein ArcB [Stieleria neptunia]|uniref:histidine kinase n=1 Tax=Stieleria neptunia TaxID=2527979 RepID=A0A518HXU7_9BACT|nr:PAS domain-containing sensor histidine kinase [Stieleria neptunia]QDV45690.1 Aerobic respiration control sensor protein ArcB [Stieleria neptunia]
MTEQSDDELPPGIPDWLRVSFIDGLPFYVVLKDLQGKFTYVNKRLANRLGLPADELVGKTDFDLFPHELAEKYRDDDRRVLQSDQATTEIEDNDAGTDSRLVKVRKSPIRNPQGKVVGIEVVFWDVTEHQMAEAQLVQERFLLHTILNNLPDFIYFKDTESRFLRVSRAHADRLGLATPSDAIGTHDSEYFPQEYAAAAREDELKLIRTGQNILGREEHAIWPDGSETWVATTKLPLRDEDGQIVGTFGISRDISELKSTAESLERAKQAAEAANRAKSEFVANLSHEIRTPMNAIIGMAELLVRAGLDDLRTQQAKTILESGESLLNLLNDILDFSRIESGRVELDPVPGDVAECARGTIRMLSVRADEKSIQLDCEVAPDLPKLILADFVRLRQILVNLIGNALKFTSQGQVTLSVAPVPSDEAPRDDTEVCIRFAVSDSGIGIPADKLNVIFEEFEQADKSTTRRFGGTGLGLAITARLVRLMGGQIDVQSQVGRGSMFSFALTFPVIDSAGSGQSGEDASATSAQAARPRRPLRILLAEDGVTNQMVATMMLSDLGHDVAVALDGRQAVELSANETFDLILMDVEMPEMDGLEATRLIRERERGTDTHLPIIAMTAHAMATDEQRCLDAGMDAYIAKPIRQDIVFETIERLLHGD